MKAREDEMKRIILLLVLILGCGPKPQYPFLGIDVNQHAFLEKSEEPFLAKLQSFIRDSKLSTLRIYIPWDWPGVGAAPKYALVDKAAIWFKGTGAEELIFNVIPAPPNRADPEWWKPWQDDLEMTLVHWYNFAFRLVEAYPNAIYLIGNEPNRLEGFAGSPRLWAQIYRVFAEAAHAASDNVKIAGPALGFPLPGNPPGSWLSAFFRHGAKIDILAIHPYNRALEQISISSSGARSYGYDLPVWAVETSGAPDQSPSTHAAELQIFGYDRVLMHVMGGWPPERRPSGIDHLILYERVDDTIVPNKDAILLRDLGRKMKG